MKLVNDKQLFDVLAAKFEGKKDKIKLKNNTYLVAQRDDGTQEIEVIHCLYHRTNVVTVFRRSDSLTLNMGGYMTSTTKERMNSIIKMVGLRLDQIKGVWSIVDAKGQRTIFKDKQSIDLTRPHGAALYGEA